MFPSPPGNPRRLGLVLAATLTLAACGGAGGPGGGAGGGGGGSGGGGGNGPVGAGFSSAIQKGTAPLVVTFRDLSTGPVTSWEWDFGDGGTSSEPEPVHEYTAPGSFDVALTVRGNGIESSLRRPAWITVAARPGNALEYGMNPSFARWSSREIVFADAMMRASEFLVVRDNRITQELAPTIPMGLTPAAPAEGWPDFAALAPGESVGAWLFGGMGGTMPDGLEEPWEVTWKGTGEVTLIGTAVVTERFTLEQRSQVWVDPDAGNGNGTVVLWIKSSSPSDPVRNVHVWFPGMRQTRQLFWEPYVERVQAMNGGAGPHTWRTLDWSAVNHVGVREGALAFALDLATTVRPGSPSQGTRRGMCVEFQVAFCNRVGANLHLNVPHRTDDLTPEGYRAYLRDLFERVRDGAPAQSGVNAGLPFEGLRDDLELTIELANELWNGGFPASRWMTKESALRGQSVHETIADELLEVWSVADEVFAGSRVARRFIGGFVAQPAFVGRILAALPEGTRVDALGPSSYFRPRPEHVERWLEGAVPGDCPDCPTAEEVLAAAWDSLDELQELLVAHRLVADAHVNPDGSSPRLVVYECGQAFDARGAPWGPAAREAQTLPGMYSAYVDGVVPMLVAAGVDVVDWYSFMTDPDPSHGVDVGYGIWDDMEQALTLPVPEPYVDEGAPKAAAIYRGPPQR